MRVFSYLVIILLLFSCSEYYDYSPYQTNASHQDLTQKSLNLLGEYSNKEFVPFDFTVIADLHNYYKKANNVVNHINRHTHSEFTIVAGDFTNIGLLQEYEYSHSVISQLKRPYLLAVGNHDLLSNGERIYKTMYGPVNFSFEYNQVKFIFLDSNQPEFGGDEPDLDWLRNELSTSSKYKHIIIVSHVAFSDSQLPKSIQDQFFQLLFEYNVSLTVHGHIHTRSIKQRQTENGGVTQTLVNGSIEHSLYSLINVAANSVTIHEIQL